MENQERIEALFFELASESRMGILRELKKQSLKMNDLGRKLDLTTTETFRQLQRLSKTSFVTKNVDGTYSLTHFGKLVLFLSPSFEFILKHKQYFLEHDIWQLPPEFIFRIGELNKGTFTEQFEAIKRVEEMIEDAEEHIWTLTSQVFAVHGRAVEERFKDGIKFRSLHPKAMVSTELEYPEFKHCIERRYLPEITEVLVVTEKEAMFALPLASGNPDVAAFFGKDPSFRKWATDFYLHYWKQGVTLHKDTKTT
jgi:predicted transcriptional regulator